MHVGILSGEFENYSLIFESVYKETTSTNKPIIGIYNKSSRLNQVMHKQFIYSRYGEKKLPFASQYFKNIFNLYLD
jgi:hypothetical protein